MSRPTIAPSDRRVPEFLPVRTVIKFAQNPNKKADNKLFSRTLGKYAFIDTHWLERNPDATLPQPGEFWFVDVVHETCHGQPNGSFLVHPIRVVAESDCKRLVPGMYEEHRYGGVLLMEPAFGGCAWMSPLVHRKSISLTSDIYSVIVMQ